MRIGTVFAQILLAGCFICVSCGTQVERTRTTSSENGLLTFPHPASYDDIEKHASDALDDDFQLQSQRCSSCHDLEGNRELGKAPACKTCHSLYPHASNFTSAHGRELIIEDCRGCHGADLLGGAFGLSCAQCHDFSGLDAKVKHTPFAKYDCSSCHTGQEMASPDLCWKCHNTAQFSFTHDHSPVTNGAACLSCHDPHGSDVSGVLKNAVYSLCKDCHKTPSTELTYRHSAVSEGIACVNCHQPHGGNREFFLGDEAAKLCFNCHKDLDQSPTYSHKPFADGDCDSCHKVHGSEFSRLLTTENPMFWYTAGTDISGTTCFDCHDYATYVTTTSFPAPGSETRPWPEFPTQFVRNRGTYVENLHQRHLSLLKPFDGALNELDIHTACLACHDPHGNGNPYLLRNYIEVMDPGTSFWAYTGTCLGCHIGTYPNPTVDPTQPGFIVDSDPW